MSSHHRFGSSWGSASSSRTSTTAATQYLDDGVPPRGQPRQPLQEQRRGYLVLRTAAPDPNSGLDEAVETQLAEIREDLAARQLPPLGPDQEARLKEQLRAAVKIAQSGGGAGGSGSGSAWSGPYHRSRERSRGASVSSLPFSDVMDSDDDSVGFPASALPVAARVSSTAAASTASTAAGALTAVAGGAGGGGGDHGAMIVEGIPLQAVSSSAPLGEAVEEDRLLQEIIGDLGADGVSLAGAGLGSFDEEGRRSHTLRGTRTRWQRFKRFLREKGPAIGAAAVVALGAILLVGTVVFFPPVGLGLIIAVGAGALAAGTIGAASDNSHRRGPRAPPPPPPPPQETVYQGEINDEAAAVEASGAAAPLYADPHGEADDPREGDGGARYGDGGYSPGYSGRVPGQPQHYRY